MHVLITSDTVGGVWTYTQELVTGLVHGGHRVTLVSFGKLPAPHQTEWMNPLPGLDYRPTEYRLEWMEVVERDIEESRHYLESLVREAQPDVLHLSQYCYGDLPVGVPKIVVAHSDVVSWWMAVHGCEPDNSPWIGRYREHVMNGLTDAEVVVAPSKWMLDQVATYYLRPRHGTVIYNGRTPALFDPSEEKEKLAVSVGRVWDPAKQVQLLFARRQSLPVQIVGWRQEPGKPPKENPVAADDVEFLSAKSQSELRELFAKAGIYVATSRYEPFGLSPLEAALSRCVLVMNDNPVFHELWGEAPIYFEKNNPDDLARVLGELQENREMREDHAQRAYQTACAKFTAERMVREYEQIYQDVCSTARMA
jgi:glycosyltransferase involved in cell wall biosynthesis